MERAIAELQRDFLSATEIDASREVMGLDTQLAADGTYFVAELDGSIVGCGGCSRRATLYGGDHSHARRESRLLHPQQDPARVRAMYTDPAVAGRGVGRRILAACEQAAAAEGSAAAELMATLAGEPLYRACGYVELERTAAAVGEVSVPLVRMGSRCGCVAFPTHRSHDGAASFALRWRVATR
ncbi:GNAT family N-acetyltransferase [Allosphingosinicella deserti]|uniref:GNAT family N-acetyltransferase n=1 Tax=Allosphingosinicella deserti TaxID=2116704 RepID=A0A2P7QWC2_9SPHN|nr:GNAT family N-acetyltransferase [Sphingomonas deserti]PSJ42253.1 GNAT family N-acetyltransferase [Sphingomonas deserti]